MDMDTIGYFLFMTEEEHKADEANENRSPVDFPPQTEEEPPQKTSGV